MNDAAISTSVDEYVDNVRVSVARDTDFDGVFDHLDLDSDNDGISDLFESGSAAGVAADTNNDGTISDAEALAAMPAGADQDDDGLQSIFDGDDTNSDPTVSTGTMPAESGDDADSTPNYLDLDSDGDGIPEAVEAQATAGYVTPDITNNATKNGVNDSGLFTPVDTDNDGTADYLDTDSDDALGDTSGPDSTESGSPAIGETYADPDGSITDEASILATFTNTDSDSSYGNWLALNPSHNIYESQNRR